MRRASAASNPVLIGAVTILVTTVAVFLAYNANNGLPFVPTTTVKVRVANGANLVAGNEVRSGGSRIGVVTDMRPVRLYDGSTGAELTLELEKEQGDLPRDSTLRIRPRSALGLKYVEVTKGTSKETFRGAETVPASQASFSTELDEVYEMFDEPTREAAQENLRGWGDAFAGRGEALGRTLEELPPLMQSLEPVMATLADPETDLDGFVRELGDAARVVAPVSEENAALFTSMADTFEALGRDPESLKAMISKSPSTMDTGIRSFRVQRPFLDDLTAFSRDFSGATEELKGALPPLNGAVKVGTPVQRRVPALNEDVRKTLGTVRDLAEAPGTNAALRGLTATVTTLNPQLRFYGPYVTVCNSFTTFFTYLAEHFSEPDTTGSAQRALANTTGRQEDSLGSMGADEPANGVGVIEGAPQYAQDQPYGAAVAADGRADCEAGQRGFVERQARFFPKQYKIARDAHSAGLQGTTFTGRSRVPKGQTFTAQPETGPYADMPESERP
jgi:phospholipid/cholesterol/gamma-HCH transport system substrate-binding protein